jgi:hypothetical protein
MGKKQNRRKSTGPKDASRNLEVVKV